MPEITGIELCLYIKNEYPDIKVIVLTGELNPVLLHSAWLNKADAILIKQVAQKLKSNKKAINFHCYNIFEKFNETKLIKVIDIARREKLIV